MHTASIHPVFNGCNALWLFAFIIPACFVNASAQAKIPVHIQDQDQYIHSGIQSYTGPTTYQVKGLHADNMVAQPHHNGPVYPAGATPQERQKINNAYVYRQTQNISGQTGGNTSARYELQAILNETRTNQQSTAPAFNYNDPEFIAVTKRYNAAFDDIKTMLENSRAISVSRAFYAVENAYGKTYLSVNEYETILTESAQFIKQWLQQNGYSSADELALHYGIQRFMGDTLTLTQALPENKHAKLTTHFPFAYDYDDFKGEKDFRNYFVTKCLATGTGQCNSLPTVYLSLAEKLGAKAYLSFAPHHALVKYPAQNTLHNYEATSNWSISDEWYMDHLFISAEAYRNGIYLDTLNTKQIAANCLVDLAWGYMQHTGTANETFIMDCLTTASEFFPKNNNIYIGLVYSSFLAHKLDALLRKYGVRDIKDLHKATGATEIYNALLQNEKTITALGYREQPQAVYDQLMQQQEFKGRQQRNTGIDAKQKRSLFSTTIK